MCNSTYIKKIHFLFELCQRQTLRVGVFICFETSHSTCTTETFTLDPGQIKAAVCSQERKQWATHAVCWILNRDGSRCQDVERRNTMCWKKKKQTSSILLSKVNTHLYIYWIRAQHVDNGKSANMQSSSPYTSAAQEESPRRLCCWLAGHQRATDRW